MPPPVVAITPAVEPPIVTSSPPRTHTDARPMRSRQRQRAHVQEPGKGRGDPADHARTGVQADA